MAGTMSREQWRRSLVRNLDTSFLTTAAVLPGIQDGGWGRVVMVASVTGPVMVMRGEVGYAAAKAGIVRLARALAVDHGAEGITANAVAPGWIASSSQTADEARQARRTPLGRSADPRGWPPPSPSCVLRAPPTSPASAWWSTAATAWPRNAHDPGCAHRRRRAPRGGLA